MAKSLEEMTALKAEIESKLQGLENDEIMEIGNYVLGLVKEVGDPNVSVNFQEDTVPVKDSDLAQGLRSY